MYNHEGYGKIPKWTLAALDRWATEGIDSGDFIMAILENTLKRAVAYADIENERAIVEIVKYAYNELPKACWGSPKAVKEWYAGLQRKRRGNLDDK